MTYYTRMLDNINGKQMLGWESCAKNKSIYYGECNGLIGGESQYIIEFDIWNNEPGWDGASPQTTAQNAVNCRLRNKIPPKSRDLNPFLYARCITYDPQSEFTDISMSHPEFKNIQGNASDVYGAILGVQDHATIQTKIKLKENSMIKDHQYHFSLDFLYNYE